MDELTLYAELAAYQLIKKPVKVRFVAKPIVEGAAGTSWIDQQGRLIVEVVSGWDRDPKHQFYVYCHELAHHAKRHPNDRIVNPAGSLHIDRLSYVVRGDHSRYEVEADQLAEVWITFAEGRVDRSNDYNGGYLLSRLKALYFGKLAEEAFKKVVNYEGK